MLSRLQPAFILIPPVERTSQGGSSSPLSCPPLTDPPPVDFAFRLDSPFFTHTRSHATHAYSGVCVWSGLSLPFPLFATLHASHPRPYPPCPLLAPSALPPPAPFHPLLLSRFFPLSLSPSSLRFDGTNTLRCPLPFRSPLTHPSPGLQRSDVFFASAYLEAAPETVAGARVQSVPVKKSAT